MLCWVKAVSHCILKPLTRCLLGLCGLKGVERKEQPNGDAGDHGRCPQRGKREGEEGVAAKSFSSKKTVGHSRSLCCLYDVMTPLLLRRGE